MKSYWVYILKCSDNSFYTGVTNDYERRFYEHESGVSLTCYTYNKRPLKLVYIEEFNDVVDAISLEKQVKGWNRKKKLALIEGRWGDLPGLAKSNS